MTSYFNDKITRDIPSFKNKGHGWYTSGSKARIMETLTSVATNFESIIGNVAPSPPPRFWISCDSIGLIMMVGNIPLLEGQGNHQELINSRSEDDG